MTSIIWNFFTLFSLWSGDSKLVCGGKALVRSVVLIKSGPFLPVDKFSAWILHTLLSLWVATCVAGGGVCCGRGSGCGGVELDGCVVVELWLGRLVFSLETLVVSCAGADGGGWRWALPGRQRRTGENTSSEQRSRIKFLRWVLIITVYYKI